jgi:hypothetical protein
MEQHAIPQQISSYEFKLVGDMTLKQFLKAAVGIILAILINTTKLIVIVKWPLMLVFAGGGLLLAFVPFEDRPLETWIFAFIKSIYSPTIYLYKKKAGRNWLEIDSKLIDVDDADKPIDNQNAFVSVQKQTSGVVPTGNKLKGFMDSIKIVGITDKKVNDKKIEEKQSGVMTENKIIQQTKGDVKVATEVKSPTEPDWREQKTDLNLKTEKLGATGQANFGAIPMPDRPDIANIIVGMATSIDGKIIDGVIVEIQDKYGNPARVIKTNSLGQFKISTPLANGRYLIIADKEGYTFDRVNVDLSDQIIEPIRIIAHN